jgi:hypothetical protein
MLHPLLKKIIIHISKLLLFVLFAGDIILWWCSRNSIVHVCCGIYSYESMLLYNPGGDEYVFLAPHYLIAPAFGILPLVWAIRRKGKQQLRHRMLNGLCLKCGYDLRATTDICPECGGWKVHRGRFDL